MTNNEPMSSKKVEGTAVGFSTGVPNAAAALGWSELGLIDELTAAVAALGYEEPTPVQRETIPLLIAGKDLLGQAATGTGKTAAFALPMLQRLSREADGRKQTGGLVLVPTRELSMQVAQQIRTLERGAGVVVATPGRALDHIKRGTLKLANLRMLVLDEADEMLDMGFAEDLDAILEATPKTRQTALFSATMPARILSIAQRHLKDPARVTIAREKTAAGKLPRVRQIAYIVPRAHKSAALDRVLDMEDPTSALVFCRTRLEVETVVEALKAHGHRAEALHGGMEQRQRDRVMQMFRTGKVELLVATDVAARGLDIEHLSHVFNYDVPASAEGYVHRIGRTGRAGRGGTAITLAEPREHRLLRAIESFTKQKIDVATVPTVADLRTRRLDLTRASLREQLLAGDFDDVRVVVETLAQEFDIVDIAAAAVKLAHAAEAGADAEHEIPAAAPQAERPSRDVRSPKRFSGGAVVGRAGEGRPAPARERKGPMEHSARLFIGAGREAGIRPGDLVGAITGEAGVNSRDLGAIEIADRFSLIEVPESRAEDIMHALRATTLRGRKVSVRRDRESPGARAKEPVNTSRTADIRRARPRQES
jgi:ATP-dependent RNA helicase DeaD